MDNYGLGLGQWTLNSLWAKNLKAPYMWAFEWCSRASSSNSVQKAEIGRSHMDLESDPIRPCSQPDPTGMGTSVCGVDRLPGARDTVPSISRRQV